MTHEQIRGFVSFSGIVCSVMLLFVNFSDKLPLVLLLAFPPIQLWLLFFSLVGMPETGTFQERFALHFPGRAMLRRLLVNAVFYFLLLTFLTNMLLKAARALGLPSAPQALLQFGKACSPQMFCVLFFTAVIVSPIVEELAFRHTAWRFLSRFLPGPAAFLIPALIFTFLHGFFVQDIPLFLLALILQNVYCKRGSLIDSILTHAVFNACSMTGLLIVRFFNLSL